MIEIVNLNKSFGNNQILANINVKFPKNKVSVVVGKSGEGKTTLFRILANLETQDSGKITMLDDNQVGLVFQSNQLFPHLTVINNLVLPLRVIQKKSKLKSKLRALKILKLLGIEGLSDKYPSNLSGGEAQRVAIARALIMDQNVLLLDEPTSALDSENIENLINLIMDLKENGKTIIIITHDISFSRRVGDDIFTLQNGELKKAN
ncbi:MAG: ATP-binding cassette domain-containing protein [Firmicutes bacterium]|nr:ATP-binding cassette domain-containing protein [Bacillota bacterium]